MYIVKYSIQIIVIILCFTSYMFFLWHGVSSSPLGAVLMVIVGEPLVGANDLCTTPTHFRRFWRIILYTYTYICTVLYL